MTALVAHYGWEELAARLRLRCFAHEPSLSSSLKFLRKTPWARTKVEGLYLFMLREQRRGRNGPEAGMAQKPNGLKARMAPKPVWRIDKEGTPAT